MWATRIGKVGNRDQQPNYPAARSTPTVDGAASCSVSMATSPRRYRHRQGALAEEPPRLLRRSAGTWADAESPLVDGEVLVCMPGGTQATVGAEQEDRRRGVEGPRRRQGRMPQSSWLTRVACGSTSLTVMAGLRVEAKTGKLRHEDHGADGSERHDACHQRGTGR